MKRSLLIIWRFFAFAFLAMQRSDGDLFAQSAQIQDPTLDIEFQEADKTDSESIEDLGYSKQIEDIFRNPVVANGLDTGTEALNRSLESIMDSVFYSLLDNDKRFGLTDNSWFQLGLRRNLLSTINGRYIVVDRFYLGPGYQRRIFETNGLGWNLGAETTGEILQIYVLTDGKRVYEQQNLGSLRSLANNWFGILPLLSRILPPSFNQNEMYDPITELATPITFPIDIESFRSMPIGSIRSYTLNAGIRISPNLAELIPSDKVRHLERLGNLKASFPISLFKRGEHRVSVFRKDVEKAWVGVQNVDRSGALLEGSLGTLYAVFKGAMGLNIGGLSWSWGGIPIAFTPLNFSFQKSIADLFDQVYEYDLSQVDARECYESAVKGNFENSAEAALKSFRGQNTGVHFQYARSQNRNEKSDTKGPNLAIYKNIRESTNSKAEVEIKDFDGKYYIIEASSELIDKNWNILVGEKEAKFQAVVEIPVKPTVDSLGKKTYQFINAKDPYRLILKYQIEDKYTHSQDVNEYISILRQVSGFSLKEIAPLPVLDTPKILRKNHELRFSSPKNSIKTLHVSPTALGRFSGQVSLSIAYSSFKQMLEQSDKIIAQKIAQVFEKAPLDTEGLDFQEYLSALFAQPMEMLNLRWFRFDYLPMVAQMIDAIRQIRDAKDPQSQLLGFLKLIETEYPREFMQSILALIPDSSGSRVLGIATSGLPNAKGEAKKQFEALNGYQKSMGDNFSTLSRYGRIKQKIAQFYLDKPKSTEGKLDVSHIQLFGKNVPILLDKNLQSTDSFEVDQRHVFLNMEIKKHRKETPFKIYLRLEEAGKLQLGKFDLGEVVLESRDLVRGVDQNGRIHYGVFITGPLSPLQRNYVLNLGGSPNQLRIVIAVSEDGEDWSQERAVEFQFENGQLKPIK